MREEGGQASVEWIGLVLLVAIALAALARFAPSAEGQSLASTLVQAVSQPGVAGMRSEKRKDSLAPRSEPSRRETFTVPPLVPVGRRAERAPRAAPPGERALLRWVRQWGEPAVAARLRRGAGLAWRRAWLGCLAYERARYGFLHPESRFPGHTIRRSEALRIANDCLSPVDLVRDWTLLTGR